MKILGIKFGVSKKKKIIIFKQQQNGTFKLSGDDADYVFYNRYLEICLIFPNLDWIKKINLLKLIKPEYEDYEFVIEQYKPENITIEGTLV